LIADSLLQEHEPGLYSEDDLLPLSAIQHMAFCPRQCALIHLECIWEENVLTAEGRLLHERTHQSQRELRGDLLIVRGLRLRSMKLGLTGQADVVEFHRVGADPTNGDMNTVAIDNLSGLWRPFPVEYKRGRAKKDNCDLVQLCAQAICLEELLSVSIERGALFYGQSRHRLDVEFSKTLRAETKRLANELHMLSTKGKTPPAEYSNRCKACSLVDACMPLLVKKRSVRSYMKSAVEETLSKESGK